MPELAAAYAAGLVACFALTWIFLFLLARRRASPGHRTLTANLKRADLYWSENGDRLVPWLQETEALDRRQSNRNAALAGFLLMFLSWAGFIFLLLIMISYRFLARSRLERRLFASALARDTALSVDEIRRLADELKA